MNASPAPLRSFRHQGIQFHVYERAEDMGAASAHALALRQIDLARTQDTVGFLIMAAPSAFPFYAAYLGLAAKSTALRDALARTHFFQFDDYPLPPSHPATFLRLLESKFFGELRAICPAVTFHPLEVDLGDPVAVCRAYAAEVLRFGPDLQLKGVGENGHWGFHEPGISLDGEPAYIAVALSAENAAQQLRDHPALFRRPEDVPRVAYTANVALFLRTRHCIEDNVPQASKSFALLAAYGSEVVDAAVPSSALKRHAYATVRTTTAAAWALEEYLARGSVTADALHRMAVSLNTDAVSTLAATLETMGLHLAS
jgi:glucosamine-6-phosphate deaminase